MLNGLIDQNARHYFFADTGAQFHSFTEGEPERAAIGATGSHAISSHIHAFTKGHIALKEGEQGTWINAEGGIVLLIVVQSPWGSRTLLGIGPCFNGPI